MNEFAKEDLKDGMVVEWRIGDRFLLLGDRFITYDGFEKIEGYDNDLNHVNCNKDYDVVKVFVVKHDSVTTLKNLFDYKNLELIWERTEATRMTTEEMRKKLEEMTGEKIKVEPSMEEMVGVIYKYCRKNKCSECVISSDEMSCNFVNYSNDEAKKAYEKVIEYGRKES